jgi:hypothetical protein
MASVSLWSVPVGLIACIYAFSAQCDSGVIGLSTAIRAREAGFDVTIFAEIFPGDEKSIKYTSCWAGADHLSIATAISLQHG